jgi:DNA transformation protein
LPVSADYAAYVMEQFGRLGVTSRKMFGGVGFYLDGLFFALIDDDVLYFKIDDMTRGDFEGRDSHGWTPPGFSGPVAYMSVPSEVLEDPDDLADWARKAAAVAARKKDKPKGKAKSKT